MEAFKQNPSNLDAEMNYLIQNTSKLLICSKNIKAKILKMGKQNQNESRQYYKDV